jgi:hypothetical protein
MVRTPPTHVKRDKKAPSLLGTKARSETSSPAFPPYVPPCLQAFVPISLIRISPLRAFVPQAFVPISLIPPTPTFTVTPRSAEKPCPTNPSASPS